MDRKKYEYRISAKSSQQSHFGPRIRTLSTSIVRTSNASIRMKFWGLCLVVVLLMGIYGFAYWSMLTDTPRVKSDWSMDKRWESFHRNVDVHRDDVLFGNTGDDADSDFLIVESEHHHTGQQGNSVAIGCAITSRTYQDLTVENIQVRLPLLRTLVPSFCSTASVGYDYHFYISFDVDDTSLHRSDFLRAIYNHFENIRSTLCPSGANVSLHFVQCSHSHNPAWAQNDAMMEAYLDNMEFYYRVNDDTLMLSPGWTETFIEVLKGFNPPNVGVVGPVHKGGNEMILTYDFVHRTHIDIFGYYYPRLFTDWWADDWVTAVYGQERTLKLPSVKLKHTQEAGQRYKVQYDNGELVHYQVAHDRRTLNRFILSAGDTVDKRSLPKRIISMSLWGADPRYTFGALRNAQLAPVFFPGWTLRVYVEEHKTDRPPRYDLPPSRLINKLSNLGAEIVYVDTDEVGVPPMMWRFLAADDMSIDAFIVRDADARLSDRDAAIVKDWLSTNASFHCVRDHPSHTQYSLSGGMFGARPKELYKVVPIPWKILMMGFHKGYGQDMAFLRKMIWRKVESIAYCHDSFSCMNWAGAHPFPVHRRGTEHVGQVFDAFGYARDDDMKIMRETPVVKECVNANASNAEPVEIAPLSGGEEIHSGHLKKLEESIEKRVVHEKMEHSLKQQLDVRDAGNDNNTKTEGMIPLANETSFNGFKPTSPSSTLKTNSNVIIWSIDNMHGPTRDIKYTTRNSKHISVMSNSYSAKCKETNTCALEYDKIQQVHHQNITAQIRKVFWNSYRQDPRLQNVTHFLCTKPLDICDLYTPFNKHLILYVTDIYGHGVSNKENWDVKFKTLALKRQNVLMANSDFHARLVEYSSGFNPLVISPVCSYVNTSYAPKTRTVLLAETKNNNFLDDFQGYLQTLLKKTNSNNAVQYITSLPYANVFNQISSYAAIIYIPMKMTSYRFCEYYSMSIPMFAPSLNLLLNWHLKYGVLDDLKNIPDYERVGATWLSSEDAIEWIRLSDIYQRPNITYFDSVKDLAKKLTTSNLMDLSKAMSMFTDALEKQTAEKWSLMLH